MTRTQRLAPVVQHTDKKERRALQEVAQSQAVFDGEQQRLTQLQDYRLEYLQKKKYEIGVFTPIELQEFNRFMQQLDQTILQQMKWSRCASGSSIKNAISGPQRVSIRKRCTRSWNG